VEAPWDLVCHVSEHGGHERFQRVCRLPERKFSGEDRNWWIGFDTGHYMDFDHDDSAFREMRFTEMMVSRYTVEDVAKMTEYLADQVVNAQNDWNRLEMTVTESSDAELE
jgi:hypothetical protein